MKDLFNKIGLLVVVSVLIALPIANAEKINCAEGVDYTKYPICKYQDEWNESELFNEKVSEEMSIRADELNENPELFMTIFQQSIDKVDRENPGLLQSTLDMKEWIYEQIHTQ